MNKHFCRIITLLRKEKKLSQKQVAQDLNISQALLSHYEKGIRECGLDFLVKISDYYNVSCDYLLGVSPQRYDKVPDIGDDNTSSTKGAVTQLVNKRIIQNTQDVIYDYVIKSGSRKLSNYVSNYFMIATYNIFRKIYSANPSNPNDMFAIETNKYNGYSNAAMHIIDTDIDIITDSKNKSTKIKNLGNQRISPEQLASDFPKTASSVFNLIQHAEISINPKK